MTQTSTAGAVRAAERIESLSNITIRVVAAIIDEETHATEILAFIEKVASSEYSRDTIIEAQTEAFALIKKVRG